MITNMSDQRTTEEKLRSFSIYTKEIEDEEASWGVSTKLKLNEDPWKIKKVLTVSDINGLSRLMISRHLIESEVLPFMNKNMVAKIESEEGALVDIWDCDRSCMYQLKLKRWLTNGCYIFNMNWTGKIVKERGLKDGDEIGLFWDCIGLKFWFRVLMRGARCDPQLRN